jgi:filamentous hemagglutinin family protein
MKHKLARVSSLQLSLTCALGACATLAFAAGPAGVKLDGTLGGSAAVLSGPTYNITQSLGRLAGGNLFFSFQYFNIATGETALYTTTSAGINNVISRVTGGYASTIDGKIELSAFSGAPNFYFINPSGVTFTANASVNVPAAFAVTTANYLKFSDGNFYADPTKTSTLSALAPEAFGFLATTRAPVDIEGAVLLAGGGAGDFQVVAGDVTIDGGGQLAAIDTGRGDVRVIATGAQAVEVPLTGTFNSTDGTVTLQAGGEIYSGAAPGNTSGGIYVSAGTLQIDGTNSATYPSDIISVASSGASPIRLDVAGATNIQNGGYIYSNTATNGSGASITLNTGALTIQGQDSFGASRVVSETLGTGTGGAINLKVTGLADIVNGGAVLSQTSGAGNGGEIAVTAGALTIEGQDSGSGGLVDSAALDAGAGGPIELNVSGQATIAGGGLIFAGTNGLGGNSGSIALGAQSLNIDGGSIVRLGDDSTGSVGQVSVTTSGSITLSKDGVISTETLLPGNAGNVSVVAGSLSVAAGSFISSSSGSSTLAPGVLLGNAGQVSVTSTGSVTISNGGYVESVTNSLGNAGNVSVIAKSLSVDGTGSSISSDSGVSYDGTADPFGNAGQISVTTTGPIMVTNGAYIASAAFAAGNAGGVSVNAGALTVAGGSTADTGIYSLASGNTGQVTVSAASLALSNAGIYSNSQAGASGGVAIDVTGAASISSGGLIDTKTFTAAHAGNVTVKAASLDIDGANSQITSGSYSTGNAGVVSVTTSGATTITNGAEITSSAFGAGNAGNVTVNAASLDVDGGAGTSQPFTGIFSSTNNPTSASAGQVSVTTSGATTLLSGGEITSDTYSAGIAGTVTVKAGSLRIDGGVSPVFTGISSSANQGSSGAAGGVSVTTSGAVSLANGAQINSNTWARGNAGDVVVNAGTLSIVGGAPATGLTVISSSAEPGSTGNAGRVLVTTSGSASLTDGGRIETRTFGSGHAGQVSVTVGGALTVAEGGEIDSNTTGAGNAGDVIITAGSLELGGTSGAGATIASAAEPGSSGNAGQVSVTTSGATTIVNGGQIQSATSGSGNAGSVTLKAESLTVEGGTEADSSLISTTAEQGSSGSAGSVTVDVSGTVTVTDGGSISSAAHGAAGQPGTVAISAGTLVVGDNGLISIKNSSTVADPAHVEPTQIDIHAGTIQMDAGQISAASSGNIAASSIDISYLQTLHLDPSSITTTSTQGNGGPITITGQGLLWLQNSSITTSVLGTTNGNGGDIRINVPYIVLDSGVIQANTTAPNASGGNVVISAEALIPSFEFDVLGGSNIVAINSAILGQNVVQAAAPDGVSGTLDVTKPTLDLGSALLGLTGTPSTPIALSRSLCTYRRGSSLSIAGRGGLPVSYRDPLWIDLGETTSGPAAGAAPAANRSVSDPPDQGLSLIACRR